MKKKVVNLTTVTHQALKDLAIETNAKLHSKNNQNGLADDVILLGIEAYKKIYAKRNPHRL